MKKIMCFLLVVVTSSFSSGLYRPVDTTSSIQFKIKNLGFNTSGSFSGLNGKIQFDPEYPAEAVFDVTVDANTINTDNNMRDDHLRNSSYFDVKNYPQIRFTSKKIMASGKKDLWLIYGNLTIKNTTREINFPFSATPSGNGYLFKGNFQINRKDYNIGGSSTIGDEVSLTLNIVTEKS